MLVQNRWSVYRHVAPDGRKYIGIAEQPVKIRWANGKGYKSNPPFWECIQEVGWDAIQHEIIACDLSKFDALKLERKLINEENTLWPNGFNRVVDNPDYNRIKHKREIGSVYGFCTVMNYWPDKDRYKIYHLRCVCGKEFTIRGKDITENLSCGCKKRENSAEG